MGTPSRFTTRHKLLFGLFAITGLFALALGFEIWSLHRIQHTLEEMKEHEEQMRLALELEDAVRSQYAHQAHFVVGEQAHLAGNREARARALELTRELGQLVDEPDAVRWLARIDRNSHEMDRVFRERIVPSVMSGGAGAMEAHDEGYELLARVEDDAHLLFALLQGATFALRDEVSELERSTRRSAILFLCAAPVFAALVAFYLGRSVARPLAQLEAGAERIGRGDLDARIDLDGPDEFGALAARFNAMTAALKEHQSQLVQSEKLATVGRLAAGVAHEINNPLSVMLGYLMLHRRKASGQLAKDLESVEREATRCKVIVQDLLDLARPAAAAPSVPVDLRGVCDEVVDSLRGSALLEGIQVSVQGSGIGLGCATKLRQVVLNLVKNAAEAAGTRGAVQIAVSEVGRDVNVAVSDTGPGVALDARVRMFEPFYTTKAQGTGLGLAVSRAIARSMGGDLELGAASPGGAIFTLRAVRALHGGTP